MQNTLVDLFSGAGGTSLGFRRAGFRIRGAVEIDQSAVQTYESNLRVRVQRQDIRSISPIFFRRALGLRRGELDVLAGCPPCQGFSRIRNEAGVNDVRNDLVVRYLAFVQEFFPKYAVFENVPGLIRSRHGRRYFAKLVDGLQECGYSPTSYLVDCADFGVPQHRSRVVIIAPRRPYSTPEVQMSHINPEHIEDDGGKLKPWRTVRDAIGHYPPLSAGAIDPRVPNHRAPRTGLRKDSARLAEFITRVPHDGGSRSDVPSCYWVPCHRKIDGFYDVYGRLAWDRPANTLTSGCTNPSKGRFLHPNQNRGLSLREAAALQGFPDDWVFCGKDIAAQIGNAVPPQLATAIGRAIAKVLRADRRIKTNFRR